MIRHDGSEEPGKAVLRGPSQPQRRARRQHGDKAQLYKPLRAPVEGGEVGRPAPLPGTSTRRLHRAEERAEFRYEGRRP